MGIQASARTQYFLLGAEIVTLVVFAAVALGRVWFGEVEGSVQPSLSWLNPFAINDLSGLTAGILLAVFIYWGWDSTVTVNEETENSTRTPGVAAIISTIILVGIYVIVVGTGGERPLMGVVLGATPYRLLHRSTVPVLVVPTSA